MGSPKDPLPIYTTGQVAAHSQSDSIWIIIHGQVFDVTTYVDEHPGGADILADVAGTDATMAYEDAGHSAEATE